MATAQAQFTISDLNDGERGAQGVGYTDGEARLFYLHDSSTSAPPDPTLPVTGTSTAAGVWTTKEPAWQSGKYYWTCHQFTKSDPSTTPPTITYSRTAVIYDSALSTANAAAAAAQATANSKPNITYSTTAPTSSDVGKAGDMWVVRNDASHGATPSSTAGDTIYMWNAETGSWVTHLAGTTTIVPGCITTTLLAADAVTAEKIDSDSINASSILTVGAFSSEVQTNISNGALAYDRATAVRGTCSTAATTAAKVVTSSGFVLATGAAVTVYFSTANTKADAALTMNVNNTGAKTIYVAGSATSSTNQLLWVAGASITFVYNGTGWVVSDNPGTWDATACSVAAGTAAKTTSANGIVVFKGVTVSVPMTNANTSTSATLNVSSLGAKNIYYGTTTTRPTTSNGRGWVAGRTVDFRFDGAYWRLKDSGTIIDGGHITTGTISADRIDAANLQIAAGNVTGTLTIGQLPSTVAEESDIPTNVSQLTNDSGFQTASQVTTITENTISTTNVVAQNLQVKAANIDGTLTIGQLPSTVAEESDIPTKVSDLTNDSGYQTASQVTTITENTISTTNVVAQNLQVNAAKILGSLSANQIDLYGKMPVYKNSTIGAQNIGGYLGFQSNTYTVADDTVVCDSYSPGNMSSTGVFTPAGVFSENGNYASGYAPVSGGEQYTVSKSLPGGTYKVKVFEYAEDSANATYTYVAQSDDLSNNGTVTFNSNTTHIRTYLYSGQMPLANPKSVTFRHYATVTDDSIAIINDDGTSMHYASASAADVRLQELTDKNGNSWDGDYSAVLSNGNFTINADTFIKNGIYDSTQNNVSIRPVVLYQNTSPNSTMTSGSITIQDAKNYGLFYIEVAWSVDSSPNTDYNSNRAGTWVRVRKNGKTKANASIMWYDSSAVSGAYRIVTINRATGVISWGTGCHVTKSTATDSSSYAIITTIVGFNPQNDVSVTN